MTTNHLTNQQQADDHAIQILSNEGAQCGDCGDQPGDRICPDCERCRGWYVAALRKAGWAPQPEHDALLAEVRRLRAELAATQTKTLATEADEIVAHCPDHGSRDGVWMDCHCAVADDLRRRAAARPSA
jgi:hypothetical protein